MSRTAKKAIVSSVQCITAISVATAFVAHSSFLLNCMAVASNSTYGQDLSIPDRNGDTEKATAIPELWTPAWDSRMKEIAGGKVPTPEQLFKYPRDAGAGEELSSVLMKAIRENPEAVLEIADSVEPFSVDCVCSTPSPEVYPDPAFDTLDTAASELWVRIHKVQSIRKPELTKKRDRCLHQLAASLRETRIRFGALPAEVVLNANAPKAREISTEQSNITAADPSCLFSSSGPKHLKADNTPGLYVFLRVSILDQSIGKLKKTLPILVCERLEKSEKNSEIKVVQTYALPRLTEEANEAWYNGDQSNPVRFIGWNAWDCFIIEFGQHQGMITATTDGHFKINVWDVDRSPLNEVGASG